MSEQSPHAAPNLSMKRSKVSVSTAQWCLVWVRKIDQIDPTVALLLPALGMASSGPALQFLKEGSCDSPGMEERKKADPEPQWKVLGSFIGPTKTLLWYNWSLSNLHTEVDCFGHGKPAARKRSQNLGSFRRDLANEEIAASLRVFHMGKLSKAGCLLSQTHKVWFGLV